MRGLLTPALTRLCIEVVSVPTLAGLQQPRDPFRSTVQHQQAFRSGRPFTATGASKAGLASNFADDADELLPTGVAAFPGTGGGAFVAPSEDSALVIQLGTKLRVGLNFFVTE